MKTGAIKASTTPIWQHSLVLFMTVSLIMFSLGLIISGQAKVFATADDSPIEEFWITNGIVNKVLPAGDVTYIAGDFSMVGPATGLGVPVDATTGSPVATYPEVNNLIMDAIADGSGGWFIGGYFTAVGGQTRNYIAHILADGSVDPAWNPGATSNIEVLALSGTTLYVGGEFHNIGGLARMHIAAIDVDPVSPTYGQVTTWNPNASAGVLSLVVSGTTVYAGGAFTSIGGPPRNYIAAIDADPVSPTYGQATAWDPNANSSVWGLAISGSTIYAGGPFTNIGGQARNRIAAIDTGSGLANSWNPDANNSVETVQVSGTTVYAGGLFNTMGGEVRNRIAAIDADPVSPTYGDPTTWDPNANAAVYEIAIGASAVYVGGGFTSIGGQTRSYIAAIDPSTGNATSWDPSASASVQTIAISGSTVYLGGNFRSIGAVRRNRIAAIDSNPASPTYGQANSWDPNCNVYIYALALSGTTVYVGGNFSNIGGQARSRIAAIDADPASPTYGQANSWNPNSNLSVRALQVSGSTLYAGGEFTSIGGQSRDYIAALDIDPASPTYGQANSWNPDASTWVYSLAISGTTLYAGGGFSTIGGQSRNRIAALDCDPGSPTYGQANSWNPNSNDYIYGIVVSGTTVYLGGSFTSIGVLSRNRAAAIDADPGSPNYGLANEWNPNVNSSIFSVAISDNTVYMGGWFTEAGGASRNYLAAIDADPGSPTYGQATSWNPDASSGPKSLACEGSTIYAGGDFSLIGGAVRYGLAVFAPEVDVTSITPNSGYNNGSVNITDLAGENFATGAIVKLKKTGEADIDASSVTVASSSRITCTFNLTGAATGAWDVYVENLDSESDTLAAGFTVQAPLPPPDVTSITPNSGYNNGAVSITNLAGSNFVSGAAVKLKKTGQSDINGTSVTVASPTRITCALNLTGATTGAWDVYVENPDTQSDTLASGFTVQGLLTPTTTAIQPISGYIGDEVAILGSNFGVSRGISYVSFASVSAGEYVSWSDTLVVCRTPAGVSGTVAVTLTTSNGTSNSQSYTINNYTFYFAEGYTGENFQEYLCIGNAGAEAVTAVITYMFKGGGNQEQQISVPPNSRSTVDVNAAVGAGREVSAKVECAQQIVAERPIYFNYQGRWSGGHDVIGATSTSLEWYFAEGYTGSGFDEWICVLNPGDLSADLTFSFQTEEAGEKVITGRSVAAHSRETFKANDLLGGAFQTSLKLSSTQPVVTERPMYFDYMGTGGWHWNGGHCVMGATYPSYAYYFAEGTTRSGFEEWLTLQNPGTSEIIVEAVYQLGEGQGAPVSKSYPIAASSRRTVYVPSEVGTDKDVSVRLSCSSPFLAERPMYFSYGFGDLRATGGHCVIGASTGASDWFLAEGYTGSGFNEWLCLQNPGDGEAVCEVNYYTQESGALQPRQFSIPAGSRRTIMVNQDAGPNYQLSVRVRVTSGSPIVVERPMYFIFRGWDGGHDVVGYLPE